MWTKRQSKAIYDREEAKKREILEKSEQTEGEEKKLNNEHSENIEKKRKKGE